jgi:hypothetical protein
MEVYHNMIDLLGRLVLMRIILGEHWKIIILIIVILSIIIVILIFCYGKKNKKNET